MKKKSSKAKRERRAVEQKSRKRSEKETQIFRRKREVKAEENVENQEKTEALLTADKWKERKKQ